MKEKQRKIAIDFFMGKEISESDRLLASGIFNYIEAWCYELKVSEFDVLRNDQNWEKVWSIYSSINKELEK
jgi:hypothetical protein